MSHYQVFCKLIYDFLITKSPQPQFLNLLNDFTDIMPKYPTEIIRPFSPSVAAKLKTSSPQTYLMINLINTSLIPLESHHNKTEDSSDLIRKILNEGKQTTIDELIDKLRDSLNSETIISNQPLLAKMFERLIKNKNLSHNVLSLLATLIPVIPDTLLFIDIPQKQTDNLISLTPLSLLSPSDVNSSLLSNIQLLKFGFLVVRDMQEKMTVESVIPLHRLTLSGSCCVEAALFSLRRHPKVIATFRKKAQYDSKVAFGAVLACLLSCVEIPELKLFVKENHKRLEKYFTLILKQAKSISLIRSFQFVVSLLRLQGLQPIVHVYSCWAEKPRKFLILHCLRTISPTDQSLPALLNEASEFLVDFPFLVCQVAQKVIFNLSIANVAALQHLANVIEAKQKSNDFILFANSIFNHELFLAASHVISLFNNDPNYKDARIQIALENIIVLTLFSELILSARHLEKFSKWLQYLEESSLKSILLKCQKENCRINCRLILMLTYMPDFARNMIAMSSFFKLFLKHINAFSTTVFPSDVKNANEPDFISKAASLCVAWHNFFVSIWEHPTTIKLEKNIQKMFISGAQTLVKLWDNKILHDLISSAFCDAVMLAETRKIIIQVIGVIQANDHSFIDFLLSVDSKETIAKFPGLKGFDTMKIERQNPMRWGFEYWINYAFGQKMAVKL